MVLRVAIVVLGTLAVLVPSRTTGPGAPPASSPVAARSVHVPAFITDGRGQVVDVDRSAFEILEDTIPQSASGLAKPPEPLTLSLAIDISSSMDAAMPEVRLALGDLLSTLRDTDTVRLYSFSDRFTEVPRARTWAAALDGLIPRGATALYDSLLQAVDRVGSGATRRALVVLTDSEDQGSRASLATVSERMLTLDAPLIVVFIGLAQTPRPVREAFDGMAETTGGRIIRTNRGQLRRTFQEIGAELLALHMLTYETIRDVVDNRAHKIEVRTPGRRDIRVRARRQYVDPR